MDKAIKNTIEDLRNKVDTLVGYLQENRLPEREIRQGIVEEWKEDRKIIDMILNESKII